MIKKFFKLIIGLILFTASIALVFFIGINSYVVDSTSQQIFTIKQVTKMLNSADYNNTINEINPNMDDKEALNSFVLKIYDCILVLGCGVRSDMTPSPMLEDRLKTAVALYELNLSNKILVSGDHGQESYDEVNVMKNYLIEKGIPSEDIFMDHAGFSTYESVYRANKIFKAQNLLIVTQKYHLHRALYIANDLRMNAYGISADIREYTGADYRELREKLARVKEVFICLQNPEPTYLGEEIPIWGNGDDTNDK